MRLCAEPKCHALSVRDSSALIEDCEVAGPLRLSEVYGVGLYPNFHRLYGNLDGFRRFLGVFGCFKRCLQGQSKPWKTSKSMQTGCRHASKSIRSAPVARARGEPRLDSMFAAPDSL